MLNTRARDFYDIYILTRLQAKNINKEHFKEALALTVEKRGAADKLANCLSIIEEIRSDKTIQDIWKAYSKKFDYASDILFDETIQSMVELAGMYLT